jgi:dihydroorotate dehydrogenase
MDIIKDLQKKLPPIRLGFSFYQTFIRPILFFLDAETLHTFIISFCKKIWKNPWALKQTKKFCSIKVEAPKVQIGNLTFLNPIGLAAGFDKNAELLHGIDSLGFGFVEIGTVTPEPQTGNPRPRIFREVSQRAIINKMGFPNDGMNVIFERIKKNKNLCKVPIGINIGKNKSTPNSHAVEDYKILLEKFKDIADYFTINISSPNTPQLKDLQKFEFINHLAIEVNRLNLTQPIFLKLSPDISHEDLTKICVLVGPNKTFTGLVLTNTLATDLGGISGFPLKKLSHQTLIRAKNLVPPNTPLISVGGIENHQDYIDRIRDGACAVQIYTTLIYQGPRAVKHILEEN